MRIYDLKQREVINIRDGCRIGYISDLLLDCEEGSVAKLIVPCAAKLFGMLGAEQEYHIPWEKVKQIGDDLVLIDCDCSKLLVDCD